ncbi:hypothetical protein IFT72_08450 [Frigoribacterium sp. CFBP 8754]|uniref:DUF6264 family protein n=1 Tax=Frigoribacterium sp. CFBP 8754 TaxID=2775290 RepID=UPI00177B8981|nr:DUF6264 family protein [Frigoribacterium sp. CFBP 8754]MBD8660218.1 hypothetical protein [Frigoribacterium sp. CFBP 8754]
MTDESSAPRDARPRPRYGEYAPEGWVSPVADAAAAREAELAAKAAESRAVDARPGAAPVTQTASTAGPATPAALSTGRRVDRIATLALIGLAVYNVVGNVVLVPNFSATLLDLLRRSGYDVDTFTSQAGLQTAGAVIAVTSLVVFVVMLWWSLRRLRVGRLSFFVPLAAGVLVTAVQVIAVFSVVLGDAAFVQSVMDAGSRP